MRGLAKEACSVMKKHSKHFANDGMPSLTIDGKRAIITMALKNRGQKELLSWLNARDIASIKGLEEKVRRYKTAFFRDLYTWGK